MKILVSGSSNGIGKAISELFLAKGHEVVGLDIAPASITHESYVHHQLDVVKDALPQYEPDIIVISHGTQNEEKAISTNLEGAIRLEREYDGGENLKSVLFIASASARNGSEFPLYCASKGGLVTYMKNTAVRLARRGVTVNSLSPGAVITGFNDHILQDKKLFDAVANESLLKKWATPEEIAEWAYFVTVINKSMTGEDLLIDNGEMIKSNFVW